MIPTKDIEDINDIKKMVDIFNDKIQHHWPEHLTKLYSFWQSRLLGDPVYTGFPFPPHAQLPINKEHFDRWLTLFTETIDNLFIGPTANEAKNRAYKIADVFQGKLAYIHNKKSNRK